MIWALRESYHPDFELIRSHGDLLFLSYKPLAADPDSHPTTEASSSSVHPSQPDPVHAHTHVDPPLPNTIPLADLSRVQVPEVDQYWASQDGKIHRERDFVFCRHGDKGMCDYCMPLEVSYILSKTWLTLAIRHQISNRESNQASLLQCASTETILLTPSILLVIYQYRHSTAHTALSIRSDTLPDRLAPSLSRWNLLHMPAFRTHALIAIVPYGRPCRVCLTRAHQYDSRCMATDRYPATGLFDWEI